MKQRMITKHPRPHAPETDDAHRAHIGQARRLVIKIGSALLAWGGSRWVARVAAEATAARQAGRDVVIVSSGAIALGLNVLGYERRPKHIAQLQAAASAGQFALMQMWHRAFKRHGADVAQVLLTHADLADRERFLNARHALSEIIRCGAIPIINENDAVATDEIKVGDNDSLSAHVASLIGADLLIILTSVDGLHTGNPESDPGAKRIGLVRQLESVQHHAGDAGSSGLGVGGMRTKLSAARTAMQRAIPVVIARGTTPKVISKILDGHDIGTLFMPASAVQSRKHWIAYTLRAKGTLTVDAGATKALLTGGKSLLASGLVHVDGQFHRGAMVDICGPHGCIARGLVTYGADELRQICGRNSREIKTILGYVAIPEIVHRDDLVLIP